MPAGAILLAAGCSRRFGSDKRRHVLPDGTPLLTASVRLYRRAFPELLIVLRAEDNVLAECLAGETAGGDVQVVICPDAHLGMGHSLACGIRAACGWSFAFVALADMAWVGPHTLTRLQRAMRAAGRDAVVQPVHGGIPGHPVGFGAAFFPRLTALTGDEGARVVVRNAGARLIRLEVDDPGVLQDMDTPPT